MDLPAAIFSISLTRPVNDCFVFHFILLQGVGLIKNLIRNFTYSPAANSGRQSPSI